MGGDLAQGLLLFFGGAALVILSGVYLARYGDALAGLLGWGRLWVGTILVAAATSLPELITSVTAASRDQPALAAGNILGSNMVNMFALAMVAILFGGAGFFRMVAPEQRYLVLTAISLTVLAVVLGSLPLGISILEVGLASVLLLALYLGGMRLVYLRRPSEAARQEVGETGSIGLRKAWLLFGLAALGVMVAASALTVGAERIAESTFLASSFMGVVALAMVTSMPEISTAIASVRLGAVDLGVGNIYGSCAFNIVIFALADPLYRQGVLVETLGSEHVAAGVVAVCLMGCGLALILTKGSYRYLPAVPILVLMGLGYLGAVYLVFSLSR